MTLVLSVSYHVAQRSGIRCFVKETKLRDRFFVDFSFVGCSRFGSSCLGNRHFVSRSFEFRIFVSRLFVNECLVCRQFVFRLFVSWLFVRTLQFLSSYTRLFVSPCICASCFCSFTEGHSTFILTCKVSLQRKTLNEKSNSTPLSSVQQKINNPPII